MRKAFYSGSRYPDAMFCNTYLDISDASVDGSQALLEETGRQGVATSRLARQHAFLSPQLVGQPAANQCPNTWRLFMI